jgi:hypothetical protein
VGARLEDRQAVSGDRLAVGKDGRWEVKGGLLPDTSPQEWHGAAAVATKDGWVIGLLQKPQDRRGSWHVVPLTEQTKQPPSP